MWKIHSQAERIKNSYQEKILLRTFKKYSRSFILDLCGISSILNVIVEIMDVKYGLLSKHLFQRTQQHGGYTKPLGNDKFV